MLYSVVSFQIGFCIFLLGLHFQRIDGISLDNYNHSSVCGQKRAQAVTNIVDVPNVTLSDYPWQVAVYNADRKHICGGSIINQRIVLSSARCFSKFDGTVLPKENYEIAAGKYYHQYDHPNDYNAQYSNIQNIHVPTAFKGLVGRFEADIAIIILSTPFTLSTNVQPVCIDLQTEYDELYSTDGIVTGWGFLNDQNDRAEVLKEFSIPYIPFDTCFDAAPKSFRRFITYDKICAGYLDPDRAVCQGDSGGSLIFPKLIGNDERYYVRGIVSISPSTNSGTCDPNQYGTYTSVAKHVAFIRELFTFATHRCDGVSLEHYNTYVNRSRRQTQTTTCPLQSFKCGSGECISEENICDGTVECKDGSDEQDECLKIICNTEILFQCNYGACIEKKKMCDGNQDCRDNSDETLTECTTEKTVVNNYGLFKFRCDSGQYIDNNEACDGFANCDDKSDETSKTCGGFICPSTTYRCNYGACIKRNAKCNGVQDCLDGSDEADCEGTPTPTTFVTQPFPPRCDLPDNCPILTDITNLNSLVRLLMEDNKRKDEEIMQLRAQVQEYRILNSRIQIKGSPAVPPP